MFQSARLKLTLWYVLITMVVSVVFSFVLFVVVHRELTRNFRRREFLLQQLSGEFDYTNPPPAPPNVSDSTIEMAENRIKVQLLYANLIVLAMSGLAGYFLAGRTLKPIAQMVDEQNRFVADASHEFRTPLTAMKTAIEVYLRDKNLMVDDAKEVLRNNLSDVDSLKKLSDSLLSLAQFENNGAKFTREKVSIKTILNSSIEKIKYLAKEKNIIIKKSIEEAFLFGDKEKLVQLFIIFLDNAVKYSLKNGKVSVSSSQKGRNITVEIKDVGIGIDKKDLPYIFKSFYRGDKSRSKELADGYGLGLSIAKKIIDVHHGTVSADSSPNKGTKFTIIFPTTTDL